MFYGRLQRVYDCIRSPNHQLNQIRLAMRLANSKALERLANKESQVDTRNEEVISNMADQVRNDSFGRLVLL